MGLLNATFRNSTRIQGCSEPLPGGHPDRSSCARLLERASTEGVRGVCPGGLEMDDLGGGRADVVGGLRGHHGPVLPLLVTQQGLRDAVVGLALVRHPTDQLVRLLDSNPRRGSVTWCAGRLLDRAGDGCHVIGVDGFRAQQSLLPRRPVGRRSRFAVRFRARGRRGRRGRLGFGEPSRDPF